MDGGSGMGIGGGVGGGRNGTWRDKWSWFRNTVAFYLHQLLTLSKKNFLLLIRNWVSTLVLLLSPIFFVVLLFGISQIPIPAFQVLNFDPQPVPIGRIPKCIPHAVPYCVSLLYAPNSDPQVNEIMNLVAAQNSLPFYNSSIDLFSSDPDHWFGVAGMASEIEAFNYIATQPNVTQASVIFLSSLPAAPSYSIWYNTSTCSATQLSVSDCPAVRIEILNAINTALITLYPFNSSTLSSSPSSSSPFDSCEYYYSSSSSSSSSSAPYCSSFNSSSIQITLSTSEYPEVQSLDTLVIDYGPLFFICGTLIFYISLLYQVVHEKENMLQQGMRAMGLKSSMYWLSWMLTSVVISVLMTAFLIATGFATGISFFTLTNPWVNVLVFFLFNLSMGQLALVCSTLMDSTRIAVIISIMIVIVTMIFTSAFSLFGNIVRPRLYDGTASAKALVVLFSFLPVFHYSKAVSDITSVSFDFGTGASIYPGGSSSASASASSSSSAGPEAGYDWDDLFREYNFVGGGVGPPTIQTIYLQLALLGFYTILTWYLDNVVPGVGKVARKPYFFLTREYWRIGERSKKSQPWRNRRKAMRLLEESGAGEDVTEEYEKARRSVNALIRAVLLSKNFERRATSIIPRVRLPRKPTVFSSPPRSPGDDGGFDESSSLLQTEELPVEDNPNTVHALQNFSLAVEPNTVFCLLGTNGAGKTTAFNLLAGQFAPTSGDAFLGSFSVTDEMDRVRDILGVCPQFDVLWNELTAREHLELFASLKKVPSHQRHSMVLDRLESVGLASVADRRVRTFSGGMKRRLSIAISCIGDPRVILLDEPTTGLDPLAKRLIWNLIRELKQERAVFLTTHSYEEADALGDRIGILCLGKLRCVGNAVELKSRYGKGFRLDITAQSELLEDVMNAKQHIQERVPDAVLVAETGERLLYSVPSGPAFLQQLVPFLREFEDLEAASNDSSPIRSCSISNTTLEEVFLEVTRAANFQEMEAEEG